jgi:hypothetical protein
VPSLPVLPEHEKTPIVKALLGLVEQLIERVQQQDEEISLLKDDINILKGKKKRPVFIGSKLDKKTQTQGSGLPDHISMPSTLGLIDV